MMHGLVPDSAVVGTAKRMARTSRKPRRKQNDAVTAATGIFAIFVAIFG